MGRFNPGTGRDWKFQFVGTPDADTATSTRGLGDFGTYMYIRDLGTQRLKDFVT